MQQSPVGSERRTEVFLVSKDTHSRSRSILSTAVVLHLNSFCITTCRCEIAHFERTRTDSASWNEESRSVGNKANKMRINGTASHLYLLLPESKGCVDWRDKMVINTAPILRRS